MIFGLLIAGLVIYIVYNFITSGKSSRNFQSIDFNVRYLGRSGINGFWREGIYPAQAQYLSNNKFSLFVGNGKQKTQYSEIASFSRDWVVVAPNKMVKAFCEDWGIPYNDK